MLLWLTLIFLSLYAALIFFYWYHWKKLEEYQVKESSDRPFISVIIAARNEEKHIGNLLTALKYQTYAPAFEVIVVDDYSEDNTAAIVNSINLPFKTLVQPQVSAKLSSKKKAIETGVGKAKGSLIVTTDADCIPSAEWLATIVSFSKENQASFIAAPVKYISTNTILSLFQSLDFMMMQGITAASIHSRFHTLCNGANLAYRREAFHEVNGFEGIDHVATGDDMLLMYKIWKKYPDRVFYLKSKSAIVETHSVDTWRGFISQRKRWASKTLVYDDKKVMFVLAFVYLFNFLFSVLLTAAIIHPTYWSILLFYLLGKSLIEFPFIHSVSKFFGEKKLLWFFLPFQPLHIIYIILTGLISQMGNYEWKGRRTK